MPTNPVKAAPSSLLQDFMELSKSRVEHQLQSVFARLQAGSSTENLSKALEYACLGGGKRIRPMLVYGTCKALDLPLERADKPACAVELIHCYSLVHDDLPAMDDDDLRRGKPSLHKAFDEATAILAGDALQSLAFELLAATSPVPDKNRLQMINTLSQAIGAEGMVGGQDLDFIASGKLLNEAELAQLHAMKTGALIQACLSLGALCQDNVDQATLVALQNYGKYIGLAFQVQDDILDVVENTQSLGKPQGSDELNEKSTYVSVLGLDAAKEKASELTDLAQEALSTLPGDAGELHDLASYITARSH